MMKVEQPPGPLAAAEESVRQALQLMIADCRTATVSFGLGNVLMFLRQKLKVDTDRFPNSVWGLALAVVAPEFGFIQKQQESGRMAMRYRGANPQFAWCPKHRRVGRVVVVRERAGVWGLRVRHGPHSCRLSLVHEEVLVKVLPSLIRRDPLIQHVVFMTLGQGDRPQDVGREVVEEVKVVSGV